MDHIWLKKFALLALKIAVSFFTLFLIGIYWKSYGFQNFLWLSDIGLFLTVAALWLHSPLLISIAVVGILPLEILWNVDYFMQLFIGPSGLAITDYMFDQKIPLYLRGLSLFHVVMPVFWIWYINKWGYQKEALYYATLCIWIVLGATYLFTNPQDNINWVFVPHIYQWDSVTPLIWIFFLMIGLPIFIFLPMHVLFKGFFTRSK